jgi:hypothetical protein
VERPQPTSGSNLPQEIYISGFATCPALSEEFVEWALPYVLMPTAILDLLGRYYRDTSYYVCEGDYGEEEHSGSEMSFKPR